MTPPRLTSSAFDDLDEILPNLAEYVGWEYSMSVEQELFARIDRLAESSGIGHRRPELGASNLYFTQVEPYLIIYERDTFPLTIHAIPPRGET